jgi:hypothetical protein
MTIPSFLVLSKVPCSSPRKGLRELYARAGVLAAEAGPTALKRRGRNARSMTRSVV